jgi:uncharacterized protein (TIGR00369 family)
MQTLPSTKSCFVCGQTNPIGLKLRFETDGNVVRTRFVPEPTHVGFKGTIHGGIISTLLDEVMVWACGVKTRRFAYCAELTVRFKHPARPGIEIEAMGELVNDRQGKLFEARGELRDPQNVLLASATGKYLPVAEKDLPGMLADFESAPPIGPAQSQANGEA